MKPLTVFLCIMVTLSLAFSIAAFAVVTQNNNVFSQNNPTASPTDFTNSPPTTTPPSSYIKNTPTPSPKPTPTQPPTEIAISFTETNRQNTTNNLTKITLTVTAQYKSGSALSINYDQFSLKLTTGRLGFTMNGGQVYPKNSGTLSIGPTHTTESFQLTFLYPTTTFNGMDDASTVYVLHYDGVATVEWINNYWR